jgi:hypothetical protein
VWDYGRLGSPSGVEFCGPIWPFSAYYSLRSKVSVGDFVLVSIKFVLNH